MIVERSATTGDVGIERQLRGQFTEQVGPCALVSDVRLRMLVNSGPGVLPRFGSVRHSV